MGLTAKQKKILVALSKTRGLTISDLAKKLDMPRGHVRDGLKYINKALLNQRPVFEDGRQVGYFSLTLEGRRLLNENDSGV